MKQAKNDSGEFAEKIKDALIAAGIAALITFLNVLGNYLAGLQANEIDAATAGLTGSALYAIRHMFRA